MYFYSSVLHHCCDSVVAMWGIAYAFLMLSLGASNEALTAVLITGRALLDDLSHGRKLADRDQEAPASQDAAC